MEEVKKQPVNNKVIKNIRKKLGLSQKELAEMLDSEQSWLSKVERGLETPDWLIKFAVLSRLLHESEMSWEDVVMSFPEPQRAREGSGEYNTSS